MKMFKSIGTWMACAAMLSSGLFAQDAPKANPIEVKEQNGEVLGSLGQERSPFIPNVSINAGWQTKQFKRGVMWDQNANADLDVEFKWHPTENGELIIGINGRVPTRNSRNTYLTTKMKPTDKVLETYTYYDDSKKYLYDRISYLLKVPTMYGKIAEIKEYQNYDEKVYFSHDREKNELDEKELRISYTQTFKEIPIIDNALGDVSVTFGWSYFEENSIYSKINPKYQMQPYNNFYSYYYKDKVYEENGIRDIAVENSNKLISYLSSQLFDENNKLTPYGEELFDELYPELEDGSVLEDYMLQELYKKAYEKIIGENDKEFQEAFDAWKEFAMILDKNYMTSVNRQIKWRDASRQEFKFALSLDDVLKSDKYTLNPNMSLNVEDSGHFWMEYGIDFTTSLIADKLDWKNSVDAYWFDHDYFKVSDTWYWTVIDQDGKTNINETKRLHEITTNPKGRKIYHSTSGFKTVNFRSTLDYKIRSNIVISPNVSVVHYLDDLLEDGEGTGFYFDDHYAVWCGINLRVNF